MFPDNDVELQGTNVPQFIMGILLLYISFKFINAITNKHKKLP